MKKFTDAYKVPDYYKNFVCKCGECRHTCCQGWNITLNLDEYHRLIGMDCDAEMRRRLDTAFAFLDNPSPDRYAVIKLNYLGFCSLLDDEGYCSLQRKYGEDTITTVCRQYPRSPKKLGGYECSCSNSCEAVIEALIENTDPITFETLSLSFDYEQPELSTPFCRDLIQENIFKILYDRNRSLTCRLTDISEMLYSITEPYKEEHPEALQKTLSRFAPLQKAAEPNEEAFSATLCLIEKLAENSPEMSNLYESLMQKYNSADEEKTFEIYLNQAKKLEKRFPDLDIWFEKILVNHIYYEGLLLLSKTKLPFSAAVSLCALKAMMKIFASAFTGDEKPLIDFVDVLAGLFRYAEHSSYDTAAAALLINHGYNTPDKISGIAAL